jgi:hypothetical protein
VTREDGSWEAVGAKQQDGVGWGFVFRGWRCVATRSFAIRLRPKNRNGRSASTSLYVLESMIESSMSVPPRNLVGCDSRHRLVVSFLGIFERIGAGPIYVPTSCMSLKQ